MKDTDIGCSFKALKVPNKQQIEADSKTHGHKRT